MEEQECEIVFVSNKSPKKENILEALAKYKLKQQEQQQHTIKTKASSSKENETINDTQPWPVKFKVSKETSKERKGQEICSKKQSSAKSLGKSQITEVNKEQNHPLPWWYNENERNKLQMEYVQHLAKRENKPYLMKNDFEISITEYVSQGKGFSADVNQSHLDFQVHEISLDGSVVHLTKMLNPLFKPNPCEGKCVITYDLLKSIDDIMLKSNEEIKSIEIDITEMDNTERINLRKILKENENYYVHEPVSVCGKLILKIGKMHDERHPQNGLFGYIQFVLYAEQKLSTKTAIDNIAKKLRKSSACFMTAENKFARSLSQLVTVKSEDSIGLCLASSNNISFGNLSFVPQPLQLGDLKGNHFNIALRKVIGNKGHIEASFRSLKDNGFINYYDNHQFGRDVPKHFIGKQLLLKQWQEAIDLILQPPELNSTDERLSYVALACIEYKLSRVVHENLDENKKNNSFKVKLLSSIKRHGENLIEAVNAIPLEWRLSYVRAYQCFLWNTIVSKRIAKFGAKLIVGDLVYASGDSGRRDYNGQQNQREVLFIDQKNIHKYTIHDVVLPLPGCNVTYPTNEVADWYKDLLLADGLLEKDFNLSLSTYGINGAYRPVVLRPSDFKWKFVHYDNPDQNLIPSDLDRLQQVELPSVSSQEGVYLGLVLEFSLPAFAWGTMALREILKMDMTAELRKSSEGIHSKKTKLKKQVRLNKVCPRQEHPSPLATNKALEEPQKKKRKEKPCIADQPLSETSKSLLDTHRNRPESAASPLSNDHTLREMKLKSSTIEKQPSRDNESFEEPLRTKRIAEKQVANKHSVKQRKNQDRSPSTTESRESQLKGITLEPATLDNPPPTTREPFKKPKLKQLKKNRIVLEPETREPFEKPLLKEEPGTSKQCAPIATDFVLELQKNLVVLQPRTCQKSQSIVNECLKEPQTNVKVEPGIFQTHSSTFAESCEEPEKKKIKLDPDIDQEEEEVLIIPSSKSTKFKSIMYVDLISEQED